MTDASLLADEAAFRRKGCRAGGAARLEPLGDVVQALQPRLFHCVEPRFLRPAVKSRAGGFSTELRGRSCLARRSAVRRRRAPARLPRASWVQRHARAGFRQGSTARAQAHLWPIMANDHARFARSFGSVLPSRRFCVTRSTSSCCRRA